VFPTRNSSSSDPRTSSEVCYETPPHGRVPVLALYPSVRQFYNNRDCPWAAARLIRCALICSVLAFSTTPALADAPIFVGHGTAASCTQVALENALRAARAEGGGRIRFRCGRAPVTIELSAGTYLPELDPLPVALTAPDNTTIDGGGLITFAPVAGESEGIFFFVDRDLAVTIQNVAIQDWWYGGINRGTLRMRNVTYLRHVLIAVHNEGTFTLQNSRISEGSHGGAIGNFGNATIVHSEISNNNGGGTVGDTGTLNVKHSIFSGNGNESSVIRDLGGITTIENCEFSNNSTMAGAISTRFDSHVTVTNSTFSRNGAFASGGAISNSGGAVIVRNTEFLNNRSTRDGGAIDNWGYLTLRNSLISGNVSNEGFGGGISNGGTLIAINSRIVSNNVRVYSGGGIASNAEGLTLIRTTVADNTPDDIWLFPSTSDSSDE
jgi:hypothetical protein